MIFSSSSEQSLWRHEVPCSGDFCESFNSLKECQEHYPPTEEAPSPCEEVATTFFEAKRSNYCFPSGQFWLRSSVFHGRTATLSFCETGKTLPGPTLAVVAHTSPTLLESAEQGAKKVLDSVSGAYHFSQTTLGSSLVALAALGLSVGVARHLYQKYQQPEEGIEEKESDLKKD